MRTATIFAVMLIAVGIVVSGYQGIPHTTRENFVDFGPLQMTADRTGAFLSSPIFGGILLLSYIGLMVLGRKKG